MNNKNSMNQPHKNKRKGFTLLEILLVIAAIGILAAIVLVAINPTRQIAQVRNAQRRSDINAIYKALEQYLIDNKDYPIGIGNTAAPICNTGTEQVGGSIDCAGKVDLRVLVPTYLAAIPKDPSGVAYQIYINSANNRIGVEAPGVELGQSIAVNPIDTTPTIVQNGLVLHLDAGDTSSYPGSGTTWTDLSGNGRNGTLNNMDDTNFKSADGVDSLYFDQTNEYVQVSDPMTVTAATFLAFIKKDNVQLTNYNGLIFSRAGNETTGMNFRESNAANERSALAYHWKGSETGFGNLKLLDTNDPWRMAAVTFTSTVATGYLTSTTGVLQSQTINGTFNSSTLSNIQVGGDASLSRYYKGNIAVVMVYNRALTESEILQNFNALRGRFGL